MKQPQLFVKVGQNKFIPVERPAYGRDVYAWDDNTQQIVLIKKVEQ